MGRYLHAHSAAAITGFAFRAMRPVFDGDPFTLGLVRSDRGADLSVIDAAGGTAMVADFAVA